jgi:hypothetical protein
MDNCLLNTFDREETKLNLNKSSSARARTGMQKLAKEDKILYGEHQRLKAVASLVTLR